MHFLIRYFSLLFLMPLWLSGPAAIAQKSGSVNVCSEINGTYSIKWTMAAPSLKLPAKSGELNLPKQYKVFELTTTDLKSNLTSLRKNGGYITLPFVDMTKGTGKMECLRFKMENSGVMPATLNDKYPEIVSLKGANTTIKSNTIRFDFDGSSMNISVNWNEVNYLYSPYKLKNKVYYLLYMKSDNNSASLPARQPH